MKDLPQIGDFVRLRTARIGKPVRAQVVEYVGEGALQAVRLRFDDPVFHDANAPFRTLYVQALREAMEAQSK